MLITSEQCFDAIAKTLSFAVRTSMPISSEKSGN